MGAGKSGQTIGYHYLFSVLFGIGRGPVNCLTHIKVADKIAWEGGASDNSVRVINSPDLFGGEKKEGGIQGVFRNFMGRHDQVLPGESALYIVGTKGPYQSGRVPDLKAALSGRVGEFRGRHMVFYDGLMSSMNPYIKEWSFRRWRTTAGWHNNQPWYPEKATIFLKNGAIRAMNAAHIVYQCTTDPAWGRGRPESEIDENSFILAANTLCSESFGLCLQWMRQDEIGNFIKVVLDHIGGVLYTDRETGLIKLKLVRADYDPNAIPHFTPDSGLISISEDDSGSSESIVDEVIVNGKDPITDETIQGRAHNLAVRRFRNGASSMTMDYPGLPTIELCNRVAERDRNAGAAGLRKFTVTLDRSGFRLHPGSVFKITYLPRGLSGIVLRAGEIDDGNMIDGKITIKCVQDVFSMPAISFVTPVENTYELNREPVAADARLVEASYRDLYLRLSTADLNVIEAGDASIAVVTSRPNVQNVGYDLIVKAEGEPNFGAANNSYFTTNAKLTVAISATETTLPLGSLIEWDSDTVVGSMALLGDEYVAITAWDGTTGTATVKRGCVDTWPQPHDLGTRIWVVDDDVGSDGRTYSEGETVQAKALSKTSSKVLDADDAALLEVTLEGRPFRPYPPADVKVDGKSIFDPPGTPAEPAVTWVERNRVTQADTLVGFFDAAVAAEAGTTYRIKIHGTDPDAAVINTYDGITSGWVYDTAKQTTDGLDASGLIYARLYAVRDGVESFSGAALPFALRKDEGYGIRYGYNYGGDPAYTA